MTFSCHTSATPAEDWAFGWERGRPMLEKAAKGWCEERLRNRLADSQAGGSAIRASSYKTVRGKYLLRAFGALTSQRVCYTPSHPPLVFPPVP